MTSLRKLRCGSFRKKRGWVCSVYQLSSSFSPTKIVQKGGYSLIRNILGPLIKNSWENVHKRGREVTPLADKKTQGSIWCCPFREVVNVDIRGGGWWFMYVHNPKSLCFLEELLQYLCNWIKTFLVPDLSFQSIPVVLSWQLGEPSCPRSHPFLDCLSASPEIISSFNRWGKTFPWHYMKRDY